MCFSMAPFINRYRAGLYRWLSSNSITGKIPATLSALTGLAELCAFFTWIHLVNTFFQKLGHHAAWHLLSTSDQTCLNNSQLIETRVSCCMALFINISSNLFEQKVPQWKSIERPHSGTNVGTDWTALPVRLLNMRTFPQHM